MGDGENEGRPESRSRRSASVRGVIPGAGERISGSLVARIDSTKVMERRRSRWLPCIARGGGSRRRCRLWKNGGASGRKEGWWSPPKSMPGVEGTRFALRRLRRADGSGGSEANGKRAHPNRYAVLNGRRLYVVGEEAVEGSDAWLERSRTRPRGFKEPRNKMTQTGKRGAVEW